MDPYLQPPAAGQIPGQPFAQFGAQRTPWWGYSLPQMGNQPTPFNEQQPINPVGDVLNPGQAGAPQQPAPAAQPDPFVPNYGKYANLLNANESTSGADPWALMAQHQRLGGDRDAWRKVQMAQNPRLAALASL